MATLTAFPKVGQQSLPSDQILRVARLDAENAYRDLAGYRIHMTLEPDGWHIDFDLKDQSLNGGGPHYLIDPTTGSIVWKNYEQ